MSGNENNNTTTPNTNYVNWLHAKPLANMSIAIYA